MAESVYVASIEARSGKSLAALGLMELASRRVERVGFFRHVVRDGDVPDREIELMRGRYGIAQDADALSGLGYDEARRLAGSDRSDELLHRILDRYQKLKAQCDFVV